MECAEHAEERAAAVQPVVHDGERDDLGQADAAAPNTTAGRIARSTGVVKKWRKPATSSLVRTRPRLTRAMSGARTNTSATAESTNVAASTIATSPPPESTYSPAPATGAAMRMPERALSSTPLACGSSSSGSIPATRPLRARRPHLLREAVGERDRVDDPDVAAVVHEQEREHDHGRHEVVADQHLAAREAVRDDSRGGRQEPGQREEAERDAARARRARQLERPDAEHDEQRAIAEQARDVAREEQAEVAVPRESLHAIVPVGH